MAILCFNHEGRAVTGTKVSVSHRYGSERGMGEGGSGNAVRGEGERYLEGACNRCGGTGEGVSAAGSTGRVTDAQVKQNGGDYFVIARGVWQVRTGVSGTGAPIRPGKGREGLVHLRGMEIDTRRSSFPESPAANTSEQR